ncbi:MAG: M23 family metallopeptidase [Bacteroidota bacterium]
MTRIALTCVFFLIFFVLVGQNQYPQNTFRPPLDIPLVLSGTFGELRSNHFHGGIDIKTQQRQGLPVYAIADGTVTRVKVSLYGYGKALYVAHPNGFTSVYAHLQKYGPKIQEYIKTTQYKKRRYEVEVFPEFGELEVKKGDIIAYTGNTGGSSGPHLHFEIRNSVTEKPTNPLLYGLEVRDATNPDLVGLFGYPLSEGSHINQSGEKIQLNFTRQTDGSFLADKVMALGTIGFGFNGFDRQDMAANKNGVYSVTQKVNGKVHTSYDFETFSFAETRYINTLIDYPHFKKYRQRIQKVFKEPYNKLSIYNQLYLDGKIVVQEGLDYNVELLIKDIEDNQTKIIIPVEGKKEKILLPKKVDSSSTFLKASVPNSFDLGMAKVYFPESTFYQDFYIKLKEGADTISIHHDWIAAHRNFTITFDVSKYSAEKKKQLFIAHLNDDLEPNYSRTYKRGNTFTTKTRNLGKYLLAIDSVPPKIDPRNFKAGKWLNNYRYLSLTISDDLSGINSYNAYLNGKWILMEYEPKKRTITYNFDDKIVEDTQCNLKVVVTDNVGNTTTFEETFYRK